MAEVGDYLVPVVFSVVRDVQGSNVPKITKERFVYRVTVEDVNECEDETLPRDWKHECHESDYTRCVNTVGAYECHCVDGTKGVTPCEGSLSSKECTHSCRDDSHVHHGERDETSCERNFKCKPRDMCAADVNRCASQALCSNIPCKDTEEFKIKGTCVNTYHCECRDGFRGSGFGDQGCENVNECASAELNDCHRNAECFDIVPSPENDWKLKYECKCFEGFHGDGITSCVAEQLCEIVEHLGLCHKNAVCTPCSSSLSEKDKHICRDSPRPDLTEELFRCQCATNMKGDGFAKDGTGCTFIDFCHDEEIGHQCNERATCVSSGQGQYDCLCAEGFVKVGQGRGSGGCINVNECEDFKMNDCHVGANCLDLVPSDSNGFQKYSCKCKQSEGWFENAAAPRPAYGDVGCFDARPPKAFLKCDDSARLDVVHESMREVFDDVSRDVVRFCSLFLSYSHFSFNHHHTHTHTQKFADCEPKYETTQQSEVQHCKCAGDVDTYNQYDYYKERAMIVKDDNVEGIGALHQKVSFPDTSLLDPTQQYLIWPGTHVQGVEYTLSIDANDETTRPPSVQTWFRQIKVIPVNECVDKTIPEQFQGRCHEYATCIDTKSSYECECLKGFDCDTCDGHLDGTGCVDMNPPQIELSGDWISYVRECGCGNEQNARIHPEEPTDSFMRSRGLGASATDMKFDTSTKTLLKIPFEGEIVRGRPIQVTCSDIVPSKKAPGAHFEGEDVECEDDLSVVWKITYNAIDVDGNHAEEVSHYVIQTRTRVLQRLLELEQFVRDFESRQGRHFDVLDSALEIVQLKGTFLGLGLRETSVLLILLLSTVAFYFELVPKTMKMIAALHSPRTMSRADFEEGMDLWLRLASFGFKGRLRRAREIERMIVVMEDE